MERNPFISYFALTNGRPPSRRFGIKQADRLSHVYAIGKTGTGKSTLLHTLVQQDLFARRGFCLVDPHGDLADKVAADAQQSGRTDIIYWNVPDASSPYGYNPLRHVRAEKRSLAVSGILEAFKKLWDDAWGPRMEHILRNALYALLETPDAILSDILRLISDEVFRKSVAHQVTNEPVRDFWLKEFPQYSFRYRADGIAPIQNKVGAFLADPTLRRILTAPQQDLHLRQLMDAGGGLIVNLAKGEIGEDSANLLGSLLVTTIGLAAFSRAETEQSIRRPFFVYIDEFQSFTTLSTANMASELRKYGIGLTLAHQYLHQLELDVRHAVIGNAGTLIVFRVGAEDATFLAREFSPTFQMEDLLNLPNYQVFLKLMIDGAPSRPFSADTVSPRM
ncbi:MAG: type IV secretion system DNA-binding domain-containing protein [Parvibaculum sp.]|uniref:type IV secretory system conjugative DNA transfer family protein n=1 Tax=Parvibaculum sp. TaxID=2024848 RepID=UPI0028470056|nr:type IV secretory system conjugative DNA transfer family protein [Parvibaculum sp.]MDR3500683.1 type IV secretion system DNA-binding domain-containing protein [Parvibaculum sp.]